MEKPVTVVLGLPHTDYVKGVGGLERYERPEEYSR